MKSTPMIFKNARLFVTKNSHTILTGLGVAGLISTTVMGIEATPKALRLLEDELSLHTEVDPIEDDPISPFDYFSKKDIIKLTYKCYIPTAIMATVSIACIIGANSINQKRNAAIAGLYSTTAATLKEYQSKMVETIGEGKAQKIKDEITQAKIDRDPVGKKEIIITGKGEMLCYDALSGRYFKNDIENLRRIQNDINYKLMSEMWISLNDLYYEMGLSRINLGNEVGWNADKKLEFDFSTMLSDTNEPCLVIDYMVDPYSDYRDYHSYA